MVDHYSRPHTVRESRTQGRGPHGSAAPGDRSHGRPRAARRADAGHARRRRGAGRAAGRQPGAHAGAVRRRRAGSRALAGVLGLEPRQAQRRGRPRHRRRPGPPATSSPPTADVVLESGAVPVDLAALRAANPALVTVSISAFGSTGPKAGWPATDLTVLAAGGQLVLTGDADRPPVRTSEPQAFLHAAGDAACGALVALAERERSGRGQHVDVSAQRSVLMATQSHVLAAPYEAPLFHRMSGGHSIAGIDVQLRLAVQGRPRRRDDAVRPVVRAVHGAARRVAARRGPRQRRRRRRRLDLLRRPAVRPPGAGRAVRRPQAGGRRAVRDRHQAAAAGGRPRAPAPRRADRDDDGAGGEPAARRARRLGRGRRPRAGAGAGPHPGPLRAPGRASGPTRRERHGSTSTRPRSPAPGRPASVGRRWGTTGGRRSTASGWSTSRGRCRARRPPAGSATSGPPSCTSSRRTASTRRAPSSRTCATTPAARTPRCTTT